MQMYTNEGVSTRGRAAIVQRLQGLAELHAAFGSGTHQTDTIDSQPMQVQLHVTDTLPAHVIKSHRVTIHFYHIQAEHGYGFFSMSHRHCNDKAGSHCLLIALWNDFQVHSRHYVAAKGERMWGAVRSVGSFPGLKVMFARTGWRLAGACDGALQGGGLGASCSWATRRRSGQPLLRCVPDLSR